MVRIIRQRNLAKLGRNIIGPPVPRLAVNGTSARRGLQEKRAHAGRVCCGIGIRWDQEMFSDIRGPVKCLSCNAVLGVKPEGGVLKSMELIGLSFDPSIDHPSDGRIIN